MDKKKWFTTLKILAAYLVAAWTFLQFVDWILNRYNVSPYWVDVLLWFFVGIIPSLMIYLYHKERIDKRILKLREKIIFPLNIILLAIALYFGFGNSDLGATTKEISYTDEQGLKQSATITKEEFRIGIPIYGFEDLSNDDSLEWLRYGIGRLLVYDIEQNKSLSSDFSYITSTTDKILEASIFNDFYVDGSYQKNGEEYSITVYKRKANNGKILAETTVSGTDLLPLIDDLTVFLTENSGFVESANLRYLDFPINEFMSDSLEAIREFIDGNYSKAVAIDKRFAMAYLENAKRSLRFSRGKLEVQDLADKAYKYRGRLPLQKKLEVNIQRNLAYENYDDATEQVKLQLEVDPHNEFYNQVLFSIYGETKQTEKYAEASDRLFRIDPNSETGTNLAEAAMVDGQDDRLIEEIKKYEIVSPMLRVYRLKPLLHKGDYKKAAAVMDEIKEAYPGWNNRWQVYDSAVVYLNENGNDIDKLKQFEGTYRSSFSEQMKELWVENDRLIQYVKNQSMDALVLASDNSVVTGFINNVTYRHRLLYNDSGKVIAIKTYLYQYSGTSSYIYWKEDEIIRRAHEAFDEGNLEEAELLYKEAIAENPEHEYLKNSLKHLNYIKSITPEALLAQHEQFIGTYGPREFWIDEGKLYYKRKAESNDLPRLELLALDENSYMDVTRTNTIMSFEVDSTSGNMASNSYSYNFEKQKWEQSDNVNTTNYFLKDD
ncbi:MAG: tetratricopeptide repeat protein [bacterium]